MSPATLVERLRKRVNDQIDEDIDFIAEADALMDEAAAAIEALAAERDEANNLLRINREYANRCEADTKAARARAETAEARLAGALNALEQTFNLIKVELHR